MADTHINAYFAEVDEKKQAVVQAKGELEAAEARLEAKKKEVGWVEEKPAEEPSQKAPDERAEADPKKKK